MIWKNKKNITKFLAIIFFYDQAQFKDADITIINTKKNAKKLLKLYKK